MGAHDHLYDLARWSRLRLKQLSQHPLCERCSSRGVVTAATVVHHKVPHKGDLKLFFDHANLASSCKPCHDIDEQRIEREGRPRQMLDEFGWPVEK